jgi:lauroyl/myristoyl acyltransferase
VRFHGLEAFHDLYAAPQGVVLVNSEFGAGICVPLLLARLGYQVSSMEGMDHLRRAGVRGVDGVDVVDIGDEGALRVQELRRARNALQRGRILHIAGDAYGGRSGVVLSFRDRVRRFAEGFGYLALLANAPAVPVFAPLGPDGRIDIELLPPLPSGPADLPRRQRVALLVGAYARLLEQKWAELPANVFLSQLRAYAALPRAERPGRGPGPAD